MKLYVQVWDIVNNLAYRKRTHFEIPSLFEDDLQRAIHYCEENHVTGILFDLDCLFGNEWCFIKGVMCDRERFDDFVYGC